jgi:hypothetical protein
MKKNWIYIKRGLSENPKHRSQMGECIWLYMHIIDRADWEQGIAYDWKDEQEAADMSMPVRTLREQRRKLDDLGYISCIQLRHSQNIIIRKWVNPRDYSGKVMNDLAELVEGDVETEPKTIDGDIQGDTKGDTKGSSQDVTPTSNSKSKSLSVKKGNLLDGMMFYGKQALEQGTDKVEEIIQTLERGLKVNITRSTNNQQVAKRIIKDGRPLDQWLSWVMTDEWRAAHLYLYADLEKVWRDFPQAFETVGYNPQGMEIGF